ncbi:transposase [bacterium]|nr:transposase [bacterium]
MLNRYEYSISTTIIEGLNNKIKTLHMQSDGFRDIKFFKLKIKAIHRGKYQLCG